MNVTIRSATIEDVPAIVAMAERFYPESGYMKIAAMTPESAAGIAILTMQSGVMLVAEKDGELVAMVSLHIDPFLFNIGISIAHELAYWIEPKHRGGLLALRLLKAAEDSSRARGAHWQRMAVLADSPPQAAALYQRQGYAPSESYFLKAL